MEKLTFAFREYSPLYWAILANNSKTDYIFITKGKDSVCYYLGSLKKFDKVRKNLQHKKFREKLIQDIKNNNKLLQNYKHAPNLSKLNLKELQKSFKAGIELALKWQKTYHLTEEEYWKGLEDSISESEQKELTHLRFESKKLIRKHWKHLVHDILEEISRKTQIDLDDFWNYTYEEILKLPKKPSTKSINSRRKEWGLIKTKNKKRLMTNKELQKYQKLIAKETKLENKEFSGLPVHKGEVIGIVKVIRSRDINQDKVFDLKNKILVTEMTKPELVPFLGGCLGIITDEGGLLCHASIVAREFNIPCIVGTKIATKVLKNNTKVKLDANTGKVSIL
ncbi:MAG: PEP-utilizing enzyme [Candidatus ainarchaeum sp.]|nr:PEP-utilizing enzyme [Candidatus ainarchaeum sp.]